jgi:hypothetical protein
MISPSTSSSKTSAVPFFSTRQYTRVLLQLSVQLYIVVRIREYSSTAVLKYYLNLVPLFYRGILYSCSSVRVEVPVPFSWKLVFVLVFVETRFRGNSILNLLLVRVLSGMVGEANERKLVCY